MEDVELDLGALLRTWWVAAAIFVLFTIVAILYAVSRPDVYEARTKLLLVDPVSSRLTSDQAVLQGNGLVPSLSVDTLNALATANDLLLNVITDLNLRDEDTGELWPVERLEGMLSPQVDTADQGDALPLLTMKVKGEDPLELKLIADWWTANFLIQSAQIFSGETSRSYEFIDTQYRETNSILNQLEEDLRLYYANTPLPILQDELEVKRAELQENLEMLAILTTQHSLESADYQETLRRIDDLTVDGSFLGFSTSNGLLITNDFTALGQQAVMQAKTLLFKLEEQIIDMEQGNENTILKFIRDNDLVLLNQRLDLKRDLVGTYISQLETAQNNLIIQTRRLEGLEKELKEQPQFLVLVKAIDNPALWQQLGLNPTAALWEQIRELGLQTEEINPAFTALTDDIINARVTVETELERIALLTQRLDETEGEVRSLEKTLDEKEKVELSGLQKDLSLELDRLRARLAAAESRYQEELQAFIDLEASVPVQRNSVRRLESQQIQYQELVNEIRAEWEALSRRVAIAELDIEQLNRQIETLNSSFNLLANLRQKARIAKSEQEGAIRVVESAVEPRVPVGPKRKVMVLIGGGLGMVLGLGASFGLYLVRSYKQPGKEEGTSEESV